MSRPVYDMAVIGGGPGGYTAALYAARAGLRTLVLEKLSPGGQMALTSTIDNYPGFPQGVDGWELSQAMAEGAQRFGAETEMAEVYSVDLTAAPKAIETSEGSFLAKTVVIATGAGPRLLGISGEEAFTGRGVNYCAHCDGMFYKGKTVAVVGGGNSAVADALYLARLCKKVYLIHRRDTLRATKVYHDTLFHTENIEFVPDSQVTALQGEDRLSGITLENLRDGSQTEVACDGLFVSIGRKPATALVEGQLELDPQGYIPADETTRTAIPGVFAVGDIRTKALRQIVTATSDGANAAHFAEEYLHE
jgi:thioredoxin reductase (NADPH)